MLHKQIGQTQLILEQGDITQSHCQAIVNAANSQLAGGGGVDGAIHCAGGPDIMAECRKIGGCPTGKAVITTAGKLAAQNIIHTVGPIYSNSQADQKLLASCYDNSLHLAQKHDLRSIAFPSISTGAYGYPLEQAAPVALRAIISYLKKEPGAFDEIRFVLFNDETFNAYKKALLELTETN